MNPVDLPVVVWAVLVSHDDDGYFGIVFDRVYAVCCVRVMFSDICRQTLQCRLSAIDVSYFPVFIVWGQHVSMVIHTLDLSGILLRRNSVRRWLSVDTRYYFCLFGTRWTV